MPSPSLSESDAGADRLADALAYRVPRMTCDHCKAAVITEVTKVAGVSSVDVDLESKLVQVRGTDLDDAAVVAAIDEAGYDAVAA